MQPAPAHPFKPEQHPCSGHIARRACVRIDLPVATHCNIQCNFCSRELACASRGRPATEDRPLTPEAAVEYLAAAKRPEHKAVGISGPGDPFANAAETLETLRLVRKRFPEMMLYLASNGLEIAPHIGEIAALNARHVTITITAVDPAIGARVYAWIRDGETLRRGQEAMRLLIERQLMAIHLLKAKGIYVQVNSIVLPGINDIHILEIAKVVAGLGADTMKCLPLSPALGTAFEKMPAPAPSLMDCIRSQCGRYVKQRFPRGNDQPGWTGAAQKEKRRGASVAAGSFIPPVLNRRGKWLCLPGDLQRRRKRDLQDGERMLLGSACRLSLPSGERFWMHRSSLVS